jgi:hypothetical protein
MIIPIHFQQKSRLEQIIPGTPLKKAISSLDRGAKLDFLGGTAVAGVCLVKSSGQMAIITYEPDPKCEMLILSVEIREDRQISLLEWFASALGYE